MDTRRTLPWLLPVVWLIGCASSARGPEAPAYEPLILDQVVEIVRTTDRKPPVVILDLDDTLFDARSRTLPILKELAQDPVFKDHPEASKRLNEAKTGNLHYDLDRTFAELDIDDTVALEKATAFWAPRFFSNKYCALDSALPGAVAYVNRLHKLGAQIVYLSGRDTPRMRRGTLQSLKSAGFPSGKGTTLVLKPAKEMDDFQFKLDAFEAIGKLGMVVAAFENEPKNLNALGEAFPKAVLVFIDSRHSKSPDLPTTESHWIKDFSPAPTDGN